MGMRSRVVITFGGMTVSKVLEMRKLLGLGRFTGGHPVELWFVKWVLYTLQVYLRNRRTPEPPHPLKSYTPWMMVSSICEHYTRYTVKIQIKLSANFSPCACARNHQFGLGYPTLTLALLPTIHHI